MPTEPVALYSSLMMALSEVLDVGATVLLGHLPAEQSEFTGLEPRLARGVAWASTPRRRARTRFRNTRAVAELLVLGFEDRSLHVS